MLNINKMKEKGIRRILAVGDIHGMYDKLMTVWRRANIEDNDIVIFLGDYTDRGINNINVIKFVLEQDKKNNIHFLCGNHEVILLETLAVIASNLYGEDIDPFDIYKLNDDDMFYLFEATKDIVENNLMYIEAANLFKELKKDDFPILKEYIKKISNLNFRIKMNINNKTYIFSHAGCNPKKKYEDQEINDIVWLREEFFNNYYGEDIYVIGHTPVQFFEHYKPIFKDNMILCDTGSFMYDGSISIVDVINKHVYSSNLMLI